MEGKREDVSLLDKVAKSEYKEENVLKPQFGKTHTAFVEKMR